LFRGRYQDVILVLSFLLGAVLKGGNAVAGLFVIKPFALVFESVAAITDAEAGSFIVLPFSHIDLGHVRLKNLFS